MSSKLRVGDFFASVLGDLNLFAKNSEFCCAVACVGKEIRCFHFLSRLRLTLEPAMWSSWPVAFCLILKPPFWPVFEGSEREVEVQTSALNLIFQIFHIYCSQPPFCWNEQTSYKHCLPGFWLAQLQSLWIAWEVRNYGSLFFLVSRCFAGQLPCACHVLHNFGQRQALAF